MITIGADPEVFLTDGENLISAINKIGGSKEEPLYIKNNKWGVAVQEDNVAAEFNIYPFEDEKRFLMGIKSGVREIEKLARKYNLKVAKVASGSFKDEELTHYNAKRFGCDPDLNAWEGKYNPTPRANDPNFRTCGGHIHIGGIFDYGIDPLAMARCFDLFVTVPCTLLDTDLKRKELYGKAGACRVKEYGVECRALSNFWIFDTKLTKMVFSKTKKAVEFLINNGEVYLEDGNIIQEAINTSNKDICSHLMRKYKV